MIRRYRALGADLPFGDPRRDHGIAMEGWFWRFTDLDQGRVIVVLCGLCATNGPGAPRWANVALAAHPGNLLTAVDLPRARPDPGGVGLRAERADGTPVLTATPERLELDLGPGARLSARIGDPWPRRPGALGGLGPAHLIPGLSQYWHPHLLGGTVHGHAELGDARIDLGGARPYGEKNWGGGGFPPRWWWGQASGFADPEVSIAFAGGELTGPGGLALPGSALRHPAATAIVVRVGGRSMRLGNPLLAPVRVRTGDGHWWLRARGPRHSVEVEGEADPAAAHRLPVPDLAAGHSRVSARQNLAGTVRLVVRRRGRVRYAGESVLAGLELGPV